MSFMFIGERDLVIEVATDSTPFWDRVRFLLAEAGFKILNAPPTAVNSFECSGNNPSSWGLSVRFGYVQLALTPSIRIHRSIVFRVGSPPIPSSAIDGI